MAANWRIGYRQNANSQRFSLLSQLHPNMVLVATTGLSITHGRFPERCPRMTCSTKSSPNRLVNGPEFNNMR